MRWPRRGRGGEATPPFPRGSRLGRPARRQTLAQANGLADSLTQHPQPSGFTLQDEARLTAQSHLLLDRGTPLRNKPVAFVSSGTSDPLKQLELLQQAVEATGLTERPGDPKDNGQSELATDSTSTHPPQVNHAVIKSAGEIHQSAQSSSHDQGAVQLPVPVSKSGDDSLSTDIATVAMTTEQLFYVDTVGDHSFKEGMEKASITVPNRAASPAESTSSEEIILFKGRARQGRAGPSAFNFTDIRAEIQEVETVSGARTSSRASTVSLPLRNNPRHRLAKQDEEDVLADYISNLREYGEEIVPSHDTDSSANALEDIAPECEANDALKFPLSANSSDETGSNVDNESDTDDEIHSAGQTKSANKASKDKAGAKARLMRDFEHETRPLYLSDASSDGLETSEVDGDEYDGFDVMDWERPSLRKKSKGSRAQLKVNVSDPDLALAMKAAWKNDRLKKAERKKLREEQRSMGRLGDKGSPNDLRYKYKTGITIDEVIEELENFLAGSDMSLALPPMDNHGRKVVHELANKFNIKSKSTGAGNERRPTLYRTIRTVKYSEAAFERLSIRIQRKYYPRTDIKTRKRSPNVRASGNAAVSYRDGEVVGEGAPELGVQNKGRAMLEKMGWSSGTALGIGNNGILQPVAHVVKRTKAGLG